MRSFAIKQGDTAPAFQATLYGGTGAVQPLTGATVVLNLRRVADGVLVVNGGAVTVVDAANGVVKYVWQPSDTATAGLYHAEFKVTFADGTIERYPDDGDFPVTIAPQVG